MARYGQGLADGLILRALQSMGLARPVVESDPIEELELRSQKHLKGAGDELITIPGFGKKSLQEVKEVLAALDMKLREAEK